MFWVVRTTEECDQWPTNIELRTGGMLMLVDDCNLAVHGSSIDDVGNKRIF
jgi:hypothetical protein